MNEDRKKAFLESYIVREKCPLILERFTLVYYSTFVLGFIFSVYLNQSQEEKEKDCESLYNWNIGCLFFCLVAAVTAFISKWLRKTSALTTHTLIILRICLYTVVSVVFIIGLSVNRFSKDLKQCTEFPIIDVCFICVESTATLALNIFLFYSLYYYFCYKPAIKPVEKRINRPKINIELAPNQKKNFELIPIDSF